MADYTAANEPWPKVLPYITREEAERAATKLCRKFGKWEDRSETVKMDASRRRDYLPAGKGARIFKPWICLSGDPSTVYRGWRRLVHSLSHRIYHYRYPYERRGHARFHHTLEAEMVAFVLSTDWLQGGLKPKAKAAPSIDEKKVAKFNALQARIARWESKQRRAENALKKLRRSIKRMESSHAVL